MLLIKPCNRCPPPPPPPLVRMDPFTAQKGVSADGDEAGVLPGKKEGEGLLQGTFHAALSGPLPTIEGNTGVR